MDVFESIDWRPSLNDLIDDEFVDVDRLERESVMYNILQETYTDPLQDYYKDNYDLVTQEHIDFIRNEEIRKMEESQQAAAEEKKMLESREKIYIPGICKKPFPFPRQSNLSGEDHALCLRVLLKFSSSSKPTATTPQERNEMDRYLKLMKIITDEQDEYLEMAKANWDGSNIKVVREDLINLKWNAKLQQLRKLHKYYNVAGTVTFSSDLRINVNFISTVLKTGEIPRLKLPPSGCRYRTNPTNPIISTKYFQTTELAKENYVYQDENCNNLAKSHDVDLVISSSGLNCLATNLNPSHNNTWILPVVIKNYDSKNIIFIDKPLPNTAKNAIEKNSWIYKYIVRYYLLRDSNDLKTHLDDPDPDPNVDIPSTNPSGTSEERTKRNAQYNVYTIGACGSSQNELMKNKIKQDYKILVRTKIDGIEVLEDNLEGNIKLVPKLEHQTALGAEAVTIEEAAKQWISLTFTPDTYVIRARIDNNYSEFLQIEKRTTVSINNELNRLYNVKGENILAMIYNIIENMGQMSPGRYLLRHTPRDGAFANIYVATDNPGKNSINLDSIYCEEICRTKPNAPWPALDKTVPTPATKFFNRMPVMYYPRLLPAQFQRYKEKKQLNEAKMTGTKTALSNGPKKKKKKKSNQSSRSQDIKPDGVKDLDDNNKSTDVMKTIDTVQI